jgi:2-polyprenyl-3-methyl-5-hydroxy-6-metoxy-1,4-benzoquinol methylase
MNAKCPIWPDSPTELVDSIPSDNLIWLYRNTFGIDISDEVPTAGISLFRNLETDFCFFSPLTAGSAEFYKKLYSKLGYVADKDEYGWASGFVPPGANVLDVGCGFGNFSNYVGHAKFTGIEPNEESVAQARKRGLDVECGSIEDIAQRGYRFDVVTTFQVLEHVEDPLGFFRSCLNVLKPGGLFIVSVPNLNGYLGARENTPLNLFPHHLTWWSLRSLNRMGNDNGLILVDYLEEKLTSMADFAQIIFKDRVDRLFGRPSQLVRPNAIDRMLNAIFF